ncbi:hypothetical protein GF391_01810 [Candidatus Uhrbacteria bacterium]|nr:hypothetical protein [Candidatus Uhrbacteria bacterium]
MEELRAVKPESVKSDELVELYGAEWVSDLCAKYSEFAEKAREMLLAGEIGKDQKQVFDFDQRDDGRFKEYLLAFHETGRMSRVIKEAISYTMLNKLKSAKDRKKLEDVAFTLIKIEEPIPRNVPEPENPDEPPLPGGEEGGEETELADLMRELDDLHLPEGHTELLGGAEADLAPELSRLMEQESSRLKAFFGRDIEVPPLPEGITKEQLEYWYEMGYKLEYWPKLIMQEDAEYPGWQHKPGKRHTPGGSSGIEFYDVLAQIQNLPKNKSNPNLQDLAPNELPGTWLLRDTRPKPNYDDGNQQYENDSIMRATLEELARTGILNTEAKSGLRNNIHPQVFAKPEFWQAMAKMLNLPPGAIVRLPRAIEANVMGQGKGYHDTDTYEWNEECYESGVRLISGYSGYGGASYVGWDDYPDGGIGFRPLVIFP